MRFWYRAEVEAIAQRHGLMPDLVQAVCLVESSGKTHAYRYEPKFWTRYMEGKPEWAGANPERVSASYGLMQCMYPVAVEMSVLERHEAPESLFVPIVGLEAGCTVLAERLKWSHGDLRSALAAYNGGKGKNAPGGELRNGAYADKVLARLAGIVTRPTDYTKG